MPVELGAIWKSSRMLRAADLVGFGLNFDIDLSGALRL